jgi:hypothetical protein
MYKKLHKANPWISFPEWLAYVKELAEASGVDNKSHS